MFFLHIFKGWCPSPRSVVIALLIASLILATILGVTQWLKNKIVIYLQNRGILPQYPLKPKYNGMPLIPPPKESKPPEKDSPPPKTTPLSRAGFLFAMIMVK